MNRTATPLNRWRRRMAFALSVVFGILLVSCDKPELPTGPTLLPPLPPPTVLRSSGPIAFVSDRDGESAIYLANEDGSVVTRLVAGWDPAWAKDGRRIAFSSNRAIHVINVDGSGLRLVLSGVSRFGGHQAWSPDGSALVFVNNSGDLELVSPDGSNRRSLYDGGVYSSSHPKWSPDGQRILFGLGAGVFDALCLGLWFVNADGSGAKQLGGPGVGTVSDSCFIAFPLGAAYAYAFEGAWSPDGSEIAFYETPAFGTDSRLEVARADGSGRRLLVSAPIIASPDWTPDGRLIYTKGPRGGPTRIFISVGGTERQLILDATAPARPTYSDWSAVWLR